MPEHPSTNAIGVQFSSPPGHLSKVGAELGISQAVSLPSDARTVITSGQYGFREDLSISPDLKEQVEMTLLNATRTLQAAGVEDGLRAVYQTTLYALRIDDELVQICRELKKKYMGGRAPVETGVTVPALYGGARVEMTFYAVASREQALNQKL
ncbi:YjgF-like protein [Melanomma pulvis-pyrius CBS 109.77]|uniref:YjgF-like protein n=1 Tax=Melanomma pulvis-pyrius CBS 109.77 TaxID=1314802 RepID=A0A6A6XAG7_9PLEO|nr:YjgF-like protein [Melanomma pulvis-pyrius CBS 109.77]